MKKENIHDIYLELNAISQIMHYMMKMAHLPILITSL